MASNRVPETEEAVLRQPASVDDDIARALAEDVGDGDLSAAAIPVDRHERARVIARAPGVVCGRPWFDGVFRAVDPRVAIEWHVDEGASVAAETALCSLEGPARALFTAERSALNFLQLLSGVATATLESMFSSAADSDGLTWRQAWRAFRASDVSVLDAARDGWRAFRSL